MSSVKRIEMRRCAAVAAMLLTVTGQAAAQRSDNGVQLISQRHAERGNVTPDDTPGFPVTISEPGSYRLDSNLILPDGDTTGIEVTAGTVTVDMNGFSIIGPDSPGTGAGIRSSGIATVVLNGTVLNVGGIGVDLPGSSSCRVERVHSLRNWGGGIVAPRSCRVVDNVANATRGIGIQVGQGSTVVGNIANFNVGLGLSLAPDAAYSQNVVGGNNGGNANPQVMGGVQMGANICGGMICP